MARPFYPVHVDLIPVIISKQTLMRQDQDSLLNTPGYRIQATWGTAIFTEIVVNGFIFSHQVYQVHQPTELLFACQAEAGILHFAIAGTIHFLSADSEPERRIDKQLYCFGYHAKEKEQKVSLKKGEHHYFQLVFSPVLLQHMLQSLKQQKIHNGSVLHSENQFHILPVTKKLKGLITQVLMEMSGTVQDLLHLNNFGLQITTRFISDTNAFLRRQFWEQKKQLKLDELEAYILDHLDAGNQALLTVTYCAKKTRMGTYHFKNLFHQQYGQSLNLFIRKKRMEKAMGLLTVSALQPGDIYLQVGYENFSSFTRAFTAYYGHPPSYYLHN